MMKCASFFAGVGGIDLGFEQAGFEIVYANEIDKNAVVTYNLNHAVPADMRSICMVNAKELPEFDVLLAGFPCQAFSIAGKQEGFNDKGRGDLFFELVRIIKIAKPKVVFLENVKNLVSHDKGRTFSTIKKILSDLGYHVSYDVMNASEYANIPQNRERIYIVATKLNSKINYRRPDRIDLTATIADFLEDESTIDPRYYYTDKTPFFEELVNHIDNAETLYQWRRKYVRENKSNLCPTLTANMGTGGHNVPLLNVLGRRDTIRKLTPKECFNLQGFPNDFRLPNLANASLYKQAGNSVVVPMIKRIAESIKMP